MRPAPGTPIAPETPIASDEVKGFVGTIEAARILGKSVHWVKRHARELGGRMGSGERNLEYPLTVIKRQKLLLEQTNVYSLPEGPKDVGNLTAEVMAELNAGVSMITLTIKYGRSHGATAKVIRAIYEEWEWMREQDEKRASTARALPRCGDCLTRYPFETMSPHLCPHCLENADVEQNEEGQVRIVFQVKPLGQTRPTEWLDATAKAPKAKEEL
jgi:hypothetical protein